MIIIINCLLLDTYQFENVSLNILTDEEKQVFSHLKEVDVVEADDGKSFKIFFNFEPNQWFTNNQLWKEYCEEPEEKISHSPINWKEGKDLSKIDEESDEEQVGKKRKHSSGTSSFFRWFVDEHDDMQFGLYIRDELQPNSLAIYQNPGEDDDDISDDEDVGFIGDEEEENEAGEEEQEWTTKYFCRKNVTK